MTIPALQEAYATRRIPTYLVESYGANRDAELTVRPVDGGH